MKVLVVCQGHPHLARGGNEIAAYELFTQIAEAPGCEAWFLGCHSGAPTGVELRGRITQPFGPRDYVYDVPTADWFGFANRDAQFPAEFAALIGRLSPDVVHFHGFGNVGVEALAIARRAMEGRASGGGLIVLTLHEYAAICAHHGQMVKRPSLALCPAASLDACSRCFPERGPTGMYLRERYIRHFLAFADRLVAPSAFLRERFVAWGIDPARIVHLPNALAPRRLGPPAPPRESDGILRVGFFGKVTPMKGIGVLLDAARLLHAGGDRAVQVTIHGTLDGQPEAMRAEAEALLARPPPNVRMLGAYAPTDVDRLMGAVDAVVVPSIWWENAPVVIEEARRNARPVLCAGIGGMAEAVADGIDGFHFEAGDAGSLASLLGRLAAMPYELSELAPRAPYADASADHLALYQSASREPKSSPERNENR